MISGHNLPLDYEATALADIMNVAFGLHRFKESFLIIRPKALKLREIWRAIVIPRAEFVPKNGADTLAFFLTKLHAFSPFLAFLGRRGRSTSTMPTRKPPSQSGNAAS